MKALKTHIRNEVKKILAESITERIVTRLREDSAYQEFFKKAMEKFKISSPADLKDPVRKKEFFDYVDKNYKGKSESLNEEGSLRMAESPAVAQKVKQIIKLLVEIDVDGETMQYILEQVGMDEQMLHQLTPGGIR